MFRIQKKKKKIGLDPDLVTYGKQDIINALQVAFEGEIILTHHCVKKKRLDTLNLGQKLMNIIMKVEILNTNKVGKI